MKIVRLKRKEERRLLRGHPWIFNNELQRTTEVFIPGEIVDVESHAGIFIGRGYINPNTLIAVRIMTRKQEELDYNFFKTKIVLARSLRVNLGFEDSYRAVYSEGDGLPGLIVDKYSDTLVIQSTTAGIDNLLPAIVPALTEIYSPKAVVIRNDLPSREIEGLKKEKRVLLGEVSDLVTFSESGLSYTVDLLEGQKTGFFFDQRENRLALEPYVRGKRTLDCFCYVGAWSLSAARFGATDVTGLDTSENAVALAAYNAKQNGLSAHFKKTDVFSELHKLRQQRELFGCIILDPPAFVKSKAKIRVALKGYKEINLCAMQLLEPGGILVTCSCSYHIDQALFREMLIDAAYAAHRQVRILEMRTQSRDHPILLTARETEYLKCAILIVD